MQIPHNISLGRGIEGDGISDDLFHYIWAKDELNFSPLINIPDTVIIKYGQPTVWYFTSKDGKIKRKNHQNMTPSHIESAFLKYTLGYDVVALYISTPLDKSSYSGKFPHSTIEYLDTNGLKTLLTSRNKDLHGILQRFIEPKATKNEIIRAIWSPKVCLLEKAENIHHLHEKKFSLYERCVTFEGPQGYFRSTPLRGPVLAGQIQKICDLLVSHICDVSFNSLQISRMAVNFKVDSRDKIWLLFTTSLRCKSEDEPYHPFGSMSTSTLITNKKLLNMDSVLHLPSTVTLSSSSAYELIRENKRTKCPSCAADAVEDKCYTIPFKSIIKQHEYFFTVANEYAHKNGDEDIQYPPIHEDIIEAIGGVGFGVMKDIPQHTKEYVQRNDIIIPNYSIREIPPIILYLYPKLDKETFLSKCREAEFMNTTVNVCEPCCLVYSELTTRALIFESDMKKVRESYQLENSVSPQKSNSKNPNGYMLPTITSGITTTRDSQEIIETKPKLFRAPTFIPSLNHIQAKKNAIGLLSNSSVNSNDEKLSSPEFPEAILSAIVNDRFFENSEYNVDDIVGMLAERKRIYSEELEKFNQNNQSNNNNSNNNNNVDDNKNGDSDRQTNNIILPTKKSSSDSKYSVYRSEIPYFIKGHRVYESKLRKKLGLENQHNHKLSKRLHQQVELNPDSMNMNMDSMLISTEIKEELPPKVAAIMLGSRGHLRFLQEALNEIHFEDAFELGLRTISTAPLTTENSSLIENNSSLIITSSNEFEKM